MNTPKVGKFGVKESVELFDLTVTVKKLAEDVYFDDNKISPDDLGDVLAASPKLSRQAGPALADVGAVPNELSELSDEETAFLKDRYGDEVEDEVFWDIFTGLATIGRATRKLVERRQLKKAAEEAAG